MDHGFASFPAKHSGAASWRGAALGWQRQSSSGSTAMRSPRSDSTSPVASVLTAAGAYRGTLTGLALFSALVNMLYLTGAFFMLQVYDRVIPSQSIPTLIGLAILAGALYLGQAGLDLFRSRILARLARAVDEGLGPRLFGLTARLPLTARGGGTDLQPLRDLDQIRGFLSGGGPAGFFDLPWMPIYLAICFLFHPLIGAAAAGGALFLVFLTLCTEVFTRKPIRAATALGTARAKLAEATRRNAEAVAAMGMAGHLAAVFDRICQRHLDAQQRAGDVSAGLSSVSKVARMALQSGVLGIGAYLVICGEASAGIIIAGSILSARALAPIEQVISHWRSFVGARQAWTRLRELLAAHPEVPDTLPLRKPRWTLSVEGVSLIPPSGNERVVNAVSFSIKSGSALGIIGPSASGKSSLVRALVGVWRPVRGTVRLDGAALDQWSAEARGRIIGYLPQDIELFEGTIGQNIARFDEMADPEAIVTAAEQAGVHDMIVHLPQGYGTRIGEDGLTLSGGQRQRIALARALFGDPFLVVLDEPNSNLDIDGEQALTRAIADLKARGSIVIVVAHRSSALANVDQMLVMVNGEAKAFGPKAQIMSVGERAAAALPHVAGLAGAA